ncbi:CAAX prenyl protease-related protein [Luteolibacter marinus]|uniref:CAAX prenyl protease-related protein n=1 Tax=Luteolibacter marinus TaxID=2776705 RepID=UPI001865D885|nr:CAAX prenyl protease-related protein [Luteolibacter marinus]
MSDRAADLRLRDTDAWVRAQVIPFAVFMGFLLLLQLFGTLLTWEHPAAPWWRHWPEQWVYPLQTVACLAVLAKFWKYYEFRWSWKWSAAGVVFGAVGIGFWLLPTVMYDRLGLSGETTGWQKWLGLAARTKGFNPAEAFGAGTPAFWAALILRFVRAVVVVALVEEIFWRSFAMRLASDWEGNYWKRPFGEAKWKSYGIVTGLFMVAHAPVDYAGAFVYGSLTYLLCIWSKNLGACVVMHAVANLLMGLFAMTYGKYGLW